jgi:hypothetical protein
MIYQKMEKCSLKIDFISNVCKNYNTTKGKMIKTIKRIKCAFFALSLLPVSTVFSQPNSINAATEAKITALLGKMTLEEKVGQMAQVAIDVIGTTNYGTKTFNIDRRS